ncbi:MAG: hypothetical protein NTY75_04910 [Candidatus Shapirobacteria bacterium]|nr:hypothetical protein [Candidatus Shapirobacteria bacterium]
MGLPSPSLKFIIKMFKKHHLGGPILTLGNQDIYADYNQILKYFSQLHYRPHHIDTPKLSSSQDLIKINSQAKNYIHASTFFESLGVKTKEYFDIDKFDFDSPKIIHDLQQPIPKKFYNYFNFILDSGTIEHIFDIKNVMDNIVKVTKIDGFVLHLTPTQNFINHGFYQISPTFFYDYYTQNGFKIIESYYIETRSNCYRFFQYDQKNDYTGLFINPLNRIGSCFLVKKVKNISSLINPTQYYYQQISQNPDSSKKDFNRSKLDKLTNIFRKFLPFKFHAYFFSLWYVLKGLVQKRKYFDLNFK